MAHHLTDTALQAATEYGGIDIDAVSYTEAEVRQYFSPENMTAMFGCGGEECTSLAGWTLEECADAVCAVLRERGEAIAQASLNADQIKRRIAAIAASECYLPYTDAGSGSGGPGDASPETLREMLAAGDFSDAEAVPLDIDLLRQTMDVLGMHLITGGDWIQIEFGQRDNGYHQIGWI